MIIPEPPPRRAQGAKTRKEGRTATFPHNPGRRPPFPRAERSEGATIHVGFSAKNVRTSSKNCRNDSRGSLNGFRAKHHCVKGGDEKDGACELSKASRESGSRVPSCSEETRDRIPPFPQTVFCIEGITCLIFCKAFLVQILFPSPLEFLSVNFETKNNESNNHWISALFWRVAHNRSRDVGGKTF